MSGGEIAALIAAIAFVLLVGALAVPILKLGRTVDAATRAITELTDRATPILASVQVTVDGVNETLDGVNHQLEKVDTLTDHVGTVTGNVSTLSALFASTLGGPLVKVAALSYGLRSAVKTRRRGEAEHEVRNELKARRGRRRRSA
ncbi:MAG TPA: DUF948 domain-containing protein [Cryptosporangiaceae bacterium]|nr:DUF948 domain-containing protein [Cryptosporangiaceae bacterium]